MCVRACNDFKLLFSFGMLFTTPRSWSDPHLTVYYRVFHAEHLSSVVLCTPTAICGDYFCCVTEFSAVCDSFLFQSHHVGSLDIFNTVEAFFITIH